MERDQTTFYIKKKKKRYKEYMYFKNYRVIGFYNYNELKQFHNFYIITQRDLEFFKNLIRENFSPEKTNHCNSFCRSKCKYHSDKEYVYS